MQRIERQDLPGLRAWETQRRNRLRRGIGRSIILGLAGIAGLLSLPAHLNPLSHLGLFDLPETDAVRSARAEAVSVAIKSRVSTRGRAPPFSDTPSVDLQPPAIADVDLGCLAKAVFGEARGDNIEAMIAVAQVVMNRSRATKQAVCQTIARAERCYFPHTCLPQPSIDNRTLRNQWRQATWVAEEVAAGRAQLRELEQAQRYHNYLQSPPWKANMAPIRRIGPMVHYASLDVDPDLSMARLRPRVNWDEPPPMAWVETEAIERQVEVLSHTQALPAPRATIRSKPDLSPTAEPSPPRTRFEPVPITGR